MLTVTNRPRLQHGNLIAFVFPYSRKAIPFSLFVYFNLLTQILLEGNSWLLALKHLQSNNAAKLTELTARHVFISNIIHF